MNARPPAAVIASGPGGRRPSCKGLKEKGEHNPRNPLKALLHLPAVLRHLTPVLEFATLRVVARITGATAGKFETGAGTRYLEEQWQATQSSK